MATSGAQEGNLNSIKGKRWNAAINRALAKRGRGDMIAELDRLAEAFLAEVEATGINGFKELGDRLDGKAAQAITGADGGPLSVNVVRFAGSIDDDSNSA